MKRCVLLIDDDWQMLDELSNIFKERRILTLTADTGFSSMRIAEKTPFDAAVVDIKLPDCDGVDLISRLKKRRPDSSYILMTAYASLQSAMKAVRHGAFEYILKPFSPEDLLKAVERGFMKKDSVERCKSRRQKLIEEKEILEKKLTNLRKLNEIFLDREAKVVELKKEINSLLKRMNEDIKYDEF